MNETVLLLIILLFPCLWLPTVGRTNISYDEEATNHVNCTNCLRDNCTNATNQSCVVECIPGYFGQFCTQPCPLRCADAVCAKDTGRCHACMAGHYGDRCEAKCVTGFHGDRCRFPCPLHCRNDVCHHVTGVCQSGCQIGYLGPRCDIVCTEGTYGRQCMAKCPQTCRNGSLCNPQTGECQYGCAAGFWGPQCSSLCQNGTYGENCDHKCSPFCSEQVCNIFSGHCASCISGMMGLFCEEVVNDNFDVSGLSEDIDVSSRNINDILESPKIILSSLLGFIGIGLTMWALVGFVTYYKHKMVVRTARKSGRTVPSWLAKVSAWRGKFASLDGKRRMYTPIKHGRSQSRQTRSQRRRSPRKRSPRKRSPISTTKSETKSTDELNDTLDELTSSVHEPVRGKFMRPGVIDRLRGVQAPKNKETIVAIPPKRMPFKVTKGSIVLLTPAEARARDKSQRKLSHNLKSTSSSSTRSISRSNSKSIPKSRSRLALIPVPKSKTLSLSSKNTKENSTGDNDDSSASSESSTIATSFDQSSSGGETATSTTTSTTTPSTLKAAGSTSSSSTSSYTITMEEAGHDYEDDSEYDEETETASTSTESQNLTSTVASQSIADGRVKRVHITPQHGTPGAAHTSHIGLATTSVTGPGENKGQVETASASTVDASCDPKDSTERFGRPSLRFKPFPNLHTESTSEPSPLIIKSRHLPTILKQPKSFISTDNSEPPDRLPATVDNTNVNPLDTQPSLWRRQYQRIRAVFNRFFASPMPPQTSDIELETWTSHSQPHSITPPSHLAPQFLLTRLEKWNDEQPVGARRAPTTARDRSHFTHRTKTRRIALGTVMEESTTTTTTTTTGATDLGTGTGTGTSTSSSTTPGSETSSSSTPLDTSGTRSVSTIGVSQHSSRKEMQDLPSSTISSYPLYDSGTASSSYFSSLPTSSSAAAKSTSRKDTSYGSSTWSSPA